MSAHDLEQSAAQDLADLISIGPDDGQAFVIQELNVTKSQYEQLVAQGNHNGHYVYMDRELAKFIQAEYEDNYWDSVLYSEDCLSDNFLRWMYGDNVWDEDAWEEVRDNCTEEDMLEYAEYTLSDVDYGY